MPRFPAILLGWETENRLPSADLPVWFAVFEHVFGGHTAEEYGTPQSTMAGAVLPLEANLRHGQPGLTDFIAALRDGEDRERHFHDRDAEGLSQPRFDRLQKTLHGCLRVPELLRDSTEAIARFVATDPLDHFEGWAMDPDGVVSALVVDELASGGRALGLLGLPRAFLLWDNCGW